MEESELKLKPITLQKWNAVVNFRIRTVFRDIVHLQNKLTKLAKTELNINCNFDYLVNHHKEWLDNNDYYTELEKSKNKIVAYTAKIR